MGTPHHTSGITRRICLPGHPTCLDEHFQSLADLASCVPPSLVTDCSGAGISTCSPSVTAFALTLGPANPGRTNLPQETLDFRRFGFSPKFSLLMPTSSLVPRPQLLTVLLQPTAQRSPTSPPKKAYSTTSVDSFSPVYFRRRIA